VLADEAARLARELDTWRGVAIGALQALAESPGKGRGSTFYLRLPLDGAPAP
jgi:hypothetical protein